MLELLGRYHEAKLISKLDLADEALEFLQSQRKLKQSQKKYETALTKLSQVSYISLSPSVKLKPLKTDTTFTPTPFSQTPLAKQLLQKINKKREEIKVIAASRFPSFYLYSDYYFYGSDPNAPFSAVKELQRSSWRAGIGVRWTLFDGFATRHTKKRLELELLRLRYEYDLQNRNYVYETKKLEREIEKNIAMQKVSKQTTQTLKNIETMAKKLGRKRLIRQTAVIKKELIKVTQEMEIEIDKAKQAYAIKKLELLTKGTRQCDLP